MSSAATAPEQPRTAPRTLRSDLEALRSRVASAVAAQPIAATATAVGIGFVVGSRLARPAIGLLLDTATRAAATWMGEAIRQAALSHLQPTDRRAKYGATDSNHGGS